MCRVRIAAACIQNRALSRSPIRLPIATGIATELLSIGRYQSGQGASAIIENINKIARYRIRRDWAVRLTAL